eukprot:542802_1
MSRKRSFNQPQSVSNSEIDTAEPPVKKHKSNMDSPIPISKSVHHDDRKEFETIFKCVANSSLCNTLQYPITMVQQIAEYAIGEFTQCANENCSKEISILTSHESMIEDNDHHINVYMQKIGYAKNVDGSEVYCLDCIGNFEKCECHYCHEYSTPEEICLEPEIDFCAFCDDNICGCCSCFYDEGICAKCDSNTHFGCVDMFSFNFDVEDMFTCKSCDRFFCYDCAGEMMGIIISMEDAICFDCYDGNGGKIICGINNRGCDTEYTSLSERKYTTINGLVFHCMQKRFCNGENCGKFICNSCNEYGKYNLCCQCSDANKAMLSKTDE